MAVRTRVVIVGHDDRAAPNTSYYIAHTRGITLEVLIPNSANHYIEQAKRQTLGVPERERGFEQ